MVVKKCVSVGANETEDAAKQELGLERLVVIFRHLFSPTSCLSSIKNHFKAIFAPDSIVAPPPPINQSRNLLFINNNKLHT